MQDHDLITGIIPSEKKTIFFALKESEHLFCFTTNEVYSLENVNKSIELQTEDGFLIGKTHNNHQIAIYVGSKTFLILNARYLRTSTYVISKSNVNETSLEKFDGIKFVGGTLNRLFSRNSMEREYTENGLQVKAYDDTRTYDIKTKEFNITLSIYLQTATFCGQQGRISWTVRAILNGQPGISAGQRVLRPTDQY